MSANVISDVKNPLVAKAREFATFAHGNQERKFTGEPYIVHPQEVAQWVAAAGGTEAEICAAWLHDVVEDCGVTIDAIREEFGFEIAIIVWGLTDTEKGNRAERKKQAIERFRVSPSSVRFIKIFDILSNLPSIQEHDPKFAAVFKQECRDLMAAFSEMQDDPHWDAVRGDAWLTLDRMVNLDGAP